MAALTGPRNTERRGPAIRCEELPLAANAILFNGALACVDASGNVVPGATSTTLKAVGRINIKRSGGSKVDNTGGAAGAKYVNIDMGVFKYANSAAADAITNADRFTDCYVVDDQTVAKTNGTSTRSKAGKVWSVDSDGVWVLVTQAS